MSGGFFEYQNNSYAIGKLTSELEYMGYKYSPKTMEELQKGLKLLKEADIYLRRIDYLFSGDDGEESFHERLKEELEMLKKETSVEVKIPHCGICENYKYGKCIYARWIIDTPKTNPNWEKEENEKLKRCLTDATECYNFCLKREE